MLLQTEHLTKDYGTYRALDDLNLTLHEGEVFGLLGPNGSGKTTALRLLLGFLRPTFGSASIVGHDCWHDGVAARREVAYLPGELRLYEGMTGRQLVAFLCRLRGQAAPDPAPLARRLDIDLDRPIANLSSGMKRKVALLQVLVLKARLVIMDEPTNTLDPNMRSELLAQIRLARDAGQTVLFSSHVLSEVEQVCDRVAILQRGRLVHVQEMTQLRETRLVRAAFQQPPGLLPPLDGLVEHQQGGREVVWEYTGPLPALLRWLGPLPLEDLRIEPHGLAAVYERYHGGIA